MNEFEKVAEEIGHGIKVVFTDGKTIVEKLPQYIKVAEDVAGDSPTVVKDVTAVVAAVSGGAAVFDSLVAAVGGLGANPEADIAVVTALAADLPKVGTYWANVKSSVTTLLQTLGADEKTIAAVFAAPAPASSAS